jgi:hypothetical protein
MRGKVLLTIAALLLLGGGAAALFPGALSGMALAREPDQVYDLSWWTVDGGGGSSGAAGSYALDGTAGQPDPGPALSGGDYRLEGGFWGGGLSGVSWYHIYLPLLARSDA